MDGYCAARHLLVSFSGRPWGFVDEALAAIGRQRQVVMTASQLFTAGQVVAASDLLDRAAPALRGFIADMGAGLVRDVPLELPAIHIDMLWHRHLHGAPGLAGCAGCWRNQPEEGAGAPAGGGR